MNKHSKAVNRLTVDLKFLAECEKTRRSPHQDAISSITHVHKNEPERRAQIRDKRDAKKEITSHGG